MCNAVHLPHFIIRVSLIFFSTEPLLWFISRNETLFAGTVILRLFEATIFLQHRKRTEKERKNKSRRVFCVYVYVYVCACMCARACVCIYVYIYLAHWVKVWNGYQRPMTLVNCNYYNKTLDQVPYSHAAFFHELL